MTVKRLSELISAVIIGVFIGLWSNGLHQKWHTLGRDAYLAYASQMFDRSYVHPPTVLRLILVWVVLALPGLALFEVIAFVAAKALSAFEDKSESIQG